MTLSDGSNCYLFPYLFNTYFSNCHVPGPVPSAGDTTEHSPCHHEAHEGSNQQTIKIISFISLTDKGPGQIITGARPGNPQLSGGALKA